MDLWCSAQIFPCIRFFLLHMTWWPKSCTSFICGSLDIRGFDAYKIIQDFSHQLYLYYHIIKSLHPSLLLSCPHACVLETWFRLCCVQLHLSLTVASFLILACSLRWWHNPVWRTLPIGTCKNVRVFFCLSRWRELIDRFGVHEISVNKNG